MKDGIYRFDLEMDTPLGRRRGNLELIIEKNWMNGYLTMFTRTIPIRNGMLTGSSLCFEGDMKTLTKMLPYKAEGTVTQSSLEMVISTQQGVYPVKGMLAEVRR